MQLKALQNRTNAKRLMVCLLQRQRIRQT